MTDFVPKKDYDRVIELLGIIITNEICMRSRKDVLKYLIDIGFTDDELVNLVNMSQDDIIEAKSDIIKCTEEDSDDDDYDPNDYPNLEPQNDRFTD